MVRILSPGPPSQLSTVGGSYTHCVFYHVGYYYSEAGQVIGSGDTMTQRPRPPCGSAHRLRLGGRDDGEGDDAPPVRCHEELLAAFRNNVHSLGLGPRDDNDDDGGDDGTTRERRRYRTLGEWSCIVGYCEALYTHADPSRRHSEFPLPLDRLRCLVGEEFVHCST